jgi:hypothetical protein
MAKPPSERQTRADIAAFLDKVSKLPARGQAGNGRLIFAMDATASRGPTWAQAIAIQTEMFEEAAKVGGLDVQLVYYRGLGDFGASPWVSDAPQLIRLMRGVGLMAGNTQIQRTLRHAAAEARNAKVNAFVFVGDAMEELPDSILQAAGELALRGVPAFMFHEGSLEPAGAVFKQIAQVTHGAYCSFDAGSAQQLRELLKAVAVYAAGGRKALADFSKRAGGMALRLTHQLDKP